MKRGGEWLAKLERLERLLLSLNSLNSLNSLFSLNSPSPPYYHNRVIIKCVVLGARSLGKRSILNVCEHFTNKCNDKIHLYNHSYIRFSIYSTEYLP